MVGCFWTPLAAKQGTWVVAHLTPQEGEDLLARVGVRPARCPKSSLDRLPKEASARWEPVRLTFESALRGRSGGALGRAPQADVTPLALALDGLFV